MRQSSYRGSRAAVWVVAAVDASDKMRRMADVRGDGTADDVEIQWAIDHLPS
ncbi:hypothetical protein LCGC14_2475410 [marine sediment metagenome]|uniref:Uncharacterized protein n=1 Tax=marine sediment metagenome TaxID=412755 RepID=A0A0F9B919_9ZZZZ